MAKRAAKAPPGRTVDINLTGAFEGWSGTARADFRAALLGDLQSGQLERIIRVLDEIITDHNFPNGDGEVASTMGDVTPFDGLFAAGAAIFEQIGKLPNR